MQIEAWLVLASCNFDDVILAAFDSSDDAWRLKDKLDVLPADTQKQIIRNAWMRPGVEPSELVGFRVWHLFKHPIVQLPASRSRRVTGP